MESTLNNPALAVDRAVPKTTTLFFLIVMCLLPGDEFHRSLLVVARELRAFACLGFTPSTSSSESTSRSGQARGKLPRWASG